ncbi:hypothetical protein P9112_014516 [Eukaryota sp. TZLM1-RC]
MLKSHLFSSANLGGIGFTKSSILCQSAFLGGGKNFIYEFSRRFPDDSHLLVPNCSPYLYELSCELEKLPPQIWTKSFPQSIQEIPNRSLFNLQFCCKKLQQKLSKIFESLDFDVRLGLAKKKNPAFANLLQDICDSTSSALVTTIPQVYGTLLSDSAWTLNMRFRSFIWPDNLPHNLICKCSREITTTHLLNCKHFITFRSKVHDAVRDQLYCMCKSHRIESFLEPLLSNLFDAENDFHKNNRGDVILPGLDGSFILLDVMSVDPCNASNERLVNSEIHNPLSNAENFKFKKYNEPLSKLASLQHAKYNLYPFVFSLFGSLAPTALRFLDDFEMIVKRRTGRNFNRLKWGRCFPQSFNGNIPEKNVLNLKYTLRTLQKRLTGMYEKDLYNNICSSAVLNQDLHSLLLEKGVCENKVSDSSLFVTIVPRRFGLCATNEAFVTKMRLYLNIPINQLLSKEKCICSNSPQLTLRHALNCSKLITYRSSLHDAVRDTVFNMAQTARISCIKEPLLKETLSLNNFSSDDRGDVYCDWIDNSEAIVDFVSCNVANDTLVHRRKT